MTLEEVRNELVRILTEPQQFNLLGQLERLIEEMAYKKGYEAGMDAGYKNGYENGRMNGY